MSDNIKRYASENYVNEKANIIQEQHNDLLNNALIKNEQALTQDEVNQVRINLHNVGQYATGLTYYPMSVRSQGIRC